MGERRGEGAYLALVFLAGCGAAAPQFALAGGNDVVFGAEVTSSKRLRNS